MILTPTRELAIQIQENIEQYSKFLNIKHLSIFGGVPRETRKSLEPRRRYFNSNPGRLLDLMQQGLLSLSQIEILVLDEADRMLDMGFVNDVKNPLPKCLRKDKPYFSRLRCLIL